MPEDTYNITPPTNMEAQENKLIALAFSKAERDFLNDKVTSQVHTHFLKLGSEMQKTERRKLELENELLIKKIEAASQASQWNDLIERVLGALQKYLVVPHEQS